ncbi:MAG: ABC transporter permease [Gammaproteobacteria bacterium]|nr:ABC transporter permease [Gammaproteobacteria bacterium]
MRTADRIAEWTSGQARLRVLRLAGNYGILFAVLLLMVVMAIANDRFLTRQNIFNVLDQAAPLGVLSVGVTLAIIGGIFDLSTGAIFAAAAVVAAKVAAVDPWLGLAAGVLVGVGLGAVNAGVLIGTGVNSFIGTLTTSLIFRGLALIMTGGMIVSVANPSFKIVGTQALFGAKYSVFVFAAVAIICSVLLTRTAFGRSVYAIGGNQQAARVVGIPVGRVKLGLLVISGSAAAISGVLTATRTGSAQADIGIGLELAAITAVVVGGTSIFGGEGAVWRSILGVLLLQIIGNAFNLMGIDSVFKQVSQGLLILAAITIDHKIRRSEP